MDSDFDKLKEALLSDRWPQAVEPRMICDTSSNAEMMERGRNILRFMVRENIENKRILDYGCGDGHLVLAAVKLGASTAVGYDIRRSPKWDNNPDKSVFTDQFDDAAKEGPYDIIVMFDVIDHLIGLSPVPSLKQAADLLTENGRIFLRCHPFTSRHATHLYHDLNKAFVHLVFTPEELKLLCPDAKSCDNAGVTTPIKTYHQMIGAAGLKIEKRNDFKDKVEPFFKTPAIMKRITAATKQGSLPEFQMGFCFIDYVLSKAS